MSKHLETELESLKKKLLSLSALVEKSVQKATLSVLKRDEKTAKAVVDADEQIDFAEVDLEEDCLKILALHQPVAIDLRFVVSVLKMNNDLERIGDLAVNIAERGLMLAQQAPINIPFDYDLMMAKTQTMLKEALDALITLNTDLAHKVCGDDDAVDELNREMYSRIFEEIKKHPGHVEMLIQYLSVSRHLERIADYATNIAEDVIYMIEGTIIRHHPET